MIDFNKIEALFGIDQIYHVLPVNDSNKHQEDCIYADNSFPVCNCKCQPNYKFSESGNKPYKAMIVIHNSFDGREGVEWANELLNQNLK